MVKEFVPNIEVLARIARAFDGNHSMKKTHLHLASKVRWNSFVKYLEWLRTNNYILYSVEDEIYVLTNSGREMFAKVLEFRQGIKSNTFAVIL
jgi:predicted transcriptional regulator